MEGRGGGVEGRGRRCGGKGEVVWYAKTECAYRPYV